MRVTVTLDADLARRLDEEQARTRQPRQAIVNEMIRLGFAVKSSAAPAPASLPPPLDLGRARVKNFDNITAILDGTE